MAGDTESGGSSRRSTKPGKKRLFLVLSILLSFILGLPFWRKLTEIYRAPLPFAAIEEHAAHVMAESLVLPCHFNFIFTGPQSIVEDNDASLKRSLEKTATAISQQMLNFITELNSSHGGCGTAFTVTVSVDLRNKCLKSGNLESNLIWPCGLMDSHLVETMQRSDDEQMDEFFWHYTQGFANGRFGNQTLNRMSSGIYTVVVMNKVGSVSNFSSESLGKLHEDLEILSLESKISTAPSGQFRTVIGKYRHAWIMGLETEEFMVDHELLILMSNLAVRFFMNGGSHRHGEYVSTEERGESIPLGADGKVILSFSLLNAQPRDWVFSWDFDQMEKQFLAPIMEALEPVALLTLESQVLYYTPKAISSFWDNKFKTYAVHSKDLPFFVNANEWHLDTSTAAAGRSKLLHFAVYIPAIIDCPLHLKLPDGQLSQTDGFTSPGWGGVVIFNPSSCTQPVKQSFQKLSVKELEPVMRIMVAQLRTLFGLSPTASEDTKNGIYGVPATLRGFAEWELDLLLRRRAAADVVSCSSTLRSLSRLVQSLPNMVIMDEIGEQVRSSLSAAQSAHKNALLGAYDAAADSAQKARAWAEEAFFQPSIMSLLYFPLEHHFAIYTPFFVPVLLHTVVAAMKEIARYRREYKKFSSML